MEVGIGEKQKENTATRMLWEPMHPVSGPHNRKRRFHNIVLSLLCRTLKTTDEAGITYIKMALLCYEIAHSQILRHF